MCRNAEPLDLDVPRLIERIAASTTRTCHMPHAHADALMHRHLDGLAALDRAHRRLALRGVRQHRVRVEDRAYQTRGVKLGVCEVKGVE